MRKANSNRSTFRFKRHETIEFAESVIRQKANKKAQSSKSVSTFDDNKNVSPVPMSLKVYESIQTAVKQSIT